MSEPWRERVEVGDAVLMLGDCREILPTLGRVDAVVTDPPYGIGYTASAPARLNSLGRANNSPIIGDDEPFNPSHLLRWPCVLFGADHYCDRLPDLGTMHVWDKHCGRASNDNFSDAELFWTSWRKKREVFRYLWKGLQQEGQGERRWHPTQKPVALMVFCVEMCRDAEVILDPYMGSGTTGIACAQLGRRFIGIELDPKHFATAVRRITEAQRQGRLFDPPRQRAEQLALLPDAAP